ncbi:MAG: eukaryotic-like serine/threonine-protein kinase [Thermoleophilaceae bacterium]|nr:eukaryotic-like serine/threonine-protein kinase [Thermoleophilaceae bacterium]
MAAESRASTLQACPACGASVDTSAAEPLAKVECPNCGEKVRAERMFDNFLIVETVGIGGMGTVYKARDTLLDRFVALKLLRKDLEGGLDETALQQEARMAASVNHPNIVQVFSSGTDHGQFYLVMELVEHGSLDDVIEQQTRLPEEQVLEAGIQTAKGLRAAYAKGLIHRDVKPANILFADEHMAKIGDFGLAGIAAEARGEIWGTPYYVAPERLNSQPEDFRSDIYSLGATLFHALAGKAPIEGETNSATELRALKQQPFLLSLVAPEVSADTARVLQRMIAPEPAQRFSSYDELVTELERAYKKLTGRDVIDVATAKRRTRRIITAAAAVLLIVGLGVFVFVRKTQKQIATFSTAIPIAELEKQAAEARHQLVLNHYNVAGTAFARIATEARERQPLYDWSRLQQGLAAMVGRDDAQMREAFQAVEKAGTKGFGREDVDLANFFLATSKTLSAPGNISMAEAAKNTASFEAFALFPFALKDINQLDVQEASQLLDQFAKAQPTGKFAWIAEYKPIAQKYLDDCRFYLNWKSQPKTSDNSNAAALKKQLKTRSAISDAILGKEKPVAPGLSTTTGSEPSQPPRQLNQKKLGAAAQKKSQWLADWKRKLIDDLNHKQFSGAIVDNTGVEYTGVASADNQTVTLKLPYGIARVAWTKLPPKTLLTISTSFVHANAPDAANRQWLCAVYANANGQADAARQLAEAAAQSKPEYREQIDLLFGR